MQKSVIAHERISDVRLSNEEITRYSRHLMMPEVTPEGQRRLKAARVLCIGAGGSDRQLRSISPRPGLGQLELSISTTSIFRICSAKFSMEQRISAVANWNPRGIGCAISIRRSTSNCTNAVSPAKTHLNLSRGATWSWTARTIFPRDICPTTSAFLRASRMCTAPCSVLKDKQLYSRLT